MTAPSRLEAAVEVWHRAIPIRQEWLSRGLTSAPADRITAETCITGIYGRLGRPRPRFVWVASPCQALPLLRGLPTHRVLQSWVLGRSPAGTPPLASDIAAGLFRLRSALEAAAAYPVSHAQLSPSNHDLDKCRKGKQPWPVLPPVEAIRLGVPLWEVFRQGITSALRVSLADGLTVRVRGALERQHNEPVPVCWYGQQDAPWLAHFDVLRRVGLATFRPADEEQLDEWIALADACGWWWPGEDACVVVERPAVVGADPVRGGWHDEVRPSRIEYRDGWRPDLI